MKSHMKNSADRTLVVVPAFNEAARLQTNLFLQSRDHLPAVDFLFVDDGSTDSTAALLDDVSQSAEHLHALHLPTNQGKAEAVRAGLNWGFDKGYTYIGFWDADLATPLDELPMFLECLQRKAHINLVMGSRVKLLGRKIERKLLRHYLGRVFATFVSIVLDLAVYDTQCGAKLFRNTKTVQDAFSSPFLSKWIFDVEILARLKRSGEELESTVVELPLRTWTDVAGSKVRAKDFIQASLELLRIHIGFKKT